MEYMSKIRVLHPYFYDLIILIIVIILLFIFNPWIVIAIIIIYYYWRKKKTKNWKEKQKEINEKLVKFKK